LAMMKRLRFSPLPITASLAKRPGSISA